jgi:hypothetical protein
MNTQLRAVRWLEDSMPKVIDTSEMPKERFQLVVRVPFEAIDTVQARQIAKELLKMCPATASTVIKLQRLRSHREPEGVKL